MSDTVYAGFLDKEQNECPYILIDKGERLRTYNEIKNKLKQFGLKIVGAGNGMCVDYSLKLSNIPSIWGNHSDIAIVADGGLVVSSDGLNDSYHSINSSGLFSTNGYLQAHTPKKYALYFHLQQSDKANDISTSYQRTNYTNGTVLDLNFSDDSCQSSWFFGKDGVLYFSFNAEYETKLGIFSENNAVFDYIVNLEPNKLYMLTSFIGVAQGTVKDKASKPMANCRLAAFRRGDFVLVGTAMSDRNGNYRMHIAAAKGEYVFIVCLDNEDAPDFEALIYDRIQVL